MHVARPIVGIFASTASSRQASSCAQLSRACVCVCVSRPVAGTCANTASSRQASICTQPSLCACVRACVCVCVCVCVCESVCVCECVCATSAWAAPGAVEGRGCGGVRRRGSSQGGKVGARAAHKLKKPQAPCSYPSWDAPTGPGRMRRTTPNQLGCPGSLLAGKPPV